MKHKLDPGSHTSILHLPKNSAQILHIFESTLPVSCLGSFESSIFHAEKLHLDALEFVRSHQDFEILSM